MDNYAFYHTISKQPQQTFFPLHSHNGDELYFYISGDCEYIVEGTTYSLSPYDLIIISRNEMHRVIHKSKSPYERMYFSIDPLFFGKAGCQEYEKIFTKKKIGKKSKIGHLQVEQSGLKDALFRFDKYNTESPDSKALLQGVFIEILHIIAGIDICDDGLHENPLITGVTKYLTENLSQPLPLDKIAAHFYISKYHLCRIFKTATGLTINQYITHKRLKLVKDLHKKGISLNQASFEAGFSEYSSFYRAYLKEFGCTPRQDYE